MRLSALTLMIEYLYSLAERSDKQDNDSPFLINTIVEYNLSRFILLDIKLQIRLRYFLHEKKTMLIDGSCVLLKKKR